MRPAGARFPAGPLHHLSRGAAGGLQLQTPGLLPESAALLVDKVLPEEPIRQWVLSVPFPLRFLFAAEPAAMGEVLAIVYRALARHLINKAGFTLTAGQTGAVTLIQRFGSALNLNIHFHMLCLDGAYTLKNGRHHFLRVPPPTPAELDAILIMITTRIGRHLERRGLLVRDLQSSHLTRAPGEDAALEILQGHSITYRIAMGPHEGPKAFTLQTVPASERTTKPFLASHAGFSLHAGVAVRGGDRKTLERLCRYITRPALAEGRLSLTPQGRVRYTLKTPYRDGTTHVVFAPLDFMARLAALVPKPRVHLTRYHGVFAPHSRWRAQVTPAGRGCGVPAVDTRTPAESPRHDLGATPEAGVPARPRQLRRLRRSGASGGPALRTRWSWGRSWNISPGAGTPPRARGSGPRCGVRCRARWRWGRSGGQTQCRGSPAGQRCAAGVVRCEKVVGRGRFRAWLPPAGAHGPRVSAVRRPRPLGPGYQQVL